MELYNIRKAQYAHSLMASGVANRWNKNNEYVIYAGSSRALAALEMVVHRASIQVGTDYKLLTIQVDALSSDIYEITSEMLPENWQSIAAYPTLQQIGSEWYGRRAFLLMQVPSVIIPREVNYIINTAHPAFASKGRIIGSEDFKWDSRLL